MKETWGIKPGKEALKGVVEAERVFEESFVREQL